METINDTNYELWLVRYADGELSTVERKAVEAWLADHPAAEEELRLYGEAPRLERDEAVKYAAAVPQPTVPLWPKVLRWSAAAAVVATFVVSAVRLFAPQEEPLQVAAAEVPTSPSPSPEQPLVPSDIPPTSLRHPSDIPPTAVGQNTPVFRPECAEITEDIKGWEVDSGEQGVESGERIAESGELGAESEEKVEEYVVEDYVVEEYVEEAAPQLIYVDNILVIDSGDVFERQLLAAADGTRERLQGTYLGRRIARRLPTGDELVAMADEQLEQAPQGIRMIFDMILAYNNTQNQ